jgi:Ni,Fe-hydrogenase maturation factor
VFIDADAEGRPGDIHCRSVPPQVPASPAFTHSCTPSGLLTSAERLYGHRPQAVVITVSAQSFAFGDALSPVVSASLPEVVAQVCEWVGAADAHPATTRSGRIPCLPISDVFC